MIICDGTNIKFEPVYPWLKLKSKLKEQRADQAACLWFSCKQISASNITVVTKKQNPFEPDDAPLVCNKWTENKPYVHHQKWNVFAFGGTVWHDIILQFTLKKHMFL